MKIHKVAFVILIIGGLNWGLEVFGIGLGSWGMPYGVVQVIYALVGLSALYEIFVHKKMCKGCDSSSQGSM